MIDKFAEGKTYYSMPELFSIVNEADGMDHGFFSNGGFYNLKYHLFSQRKLSGNNLEIYPAQFLVLARYYMFHEKEQVTHTPQETGDFLVKWMNAFYEYMNDTNPGREFSRENLVKKQNSAFQVPLYDNTMPLDVVVADAQRLGGFTDEDRDYPDPVGLFYCTDEMGEQRRVTRPEKETDEEKKKRIYDFWKAQLARVTEIFCKTLEIKTEDIDTDLIRLLSHSDVVHAVFVLMIYYAQRYKSYDGLNNSVEYTPSYRNAPFFLMDISYLNRSHALFSTKNNTKLIKEINKFFGELMSMYIAPSINQKNTFCINYYRKAEYETELYKKIYADIQLPPFAMLDMGGRMYEKGFAFYGISLSAIEQFLYAVREIKASDNSVDTVAVPKLVLESLKRSVDVPKKPKVSERFTIVPKTVPYYSFNFDIEGSEKKAFGKNEIDAVIERVTAGAKQYCIGFCRRAAQTDEVRMLQANTLYQNVAENVHTEGVKSDEKDLKDLEDILSEYYNKKKSGKKKYDPLDGVRRSMLSVWDTFGYKSDVLLVEQLDTTLKNKLLFSKELSTDLAENMTTIVARCLTMFKLLLRNWAEFRQCEDKNSIDADTKDQFVLFQAGHYFDFNAIDSSLLKEEQDFKSSVKAGLKGDADNGEKE